MKQDSTYAKIAVVLCYFVFLHNSAVGGRLISNNFSQQIVRKMSRDNYVISHWLIRYSDLSN